MSYAKMASFFFGDTCSISEESVGLLCVAATPMFRRASSLFVFPESRRWSLFFVFLVSQVGEGKPDRSAFPGPNRRAGTSKAVARQDELFLER